MRLEEHHEPAAVADGGEIGRELGGMVRVAVEDGHAARLALRLEPAAGAAELDDRRLRVGARHAGELEGRERGRRVPPVVLSRHARARAPTGSSSSARTTCGTSRSQSSKNASTSAREAKVVWWSRSTLRSTAISGRRAPTERSDSSPSTTSQPDPARALPPSCSHVAPDEERSGRARAGRGRRRSSRSSSSSRARRRRRSSAAARRARRGGRRAAVRRPGRRTRWRRYTSQPAGGCGGSGEISTAMPSRWRRYGVSTRSQPATSAPQACASERVAAHAGAADAGEPDAPTGERLRGRRAHPRSPPLRRVSRPRASPRPWPRGGLRRSSSSSTTPRRARGVRLGDDHRAAGVGEPARVLLLMVARRERAGDEHRRQAPPRRAPRPSRPPVRARRRPRRTRRRSRP